jgi:hypothetical protein
VNKRGRRTRAILIVLAAAVLIAGIWWYVRYLRGPRYQLKAAFVKDGPKLDGRGDDNVWKTAAATAVPMKDGTSVQIKAVYTRDKVYVLVRYRDSSKNDTADPWQYNGQAWVRTGKSDAAGLFFENGDSIPEFSTKGFDIMDYWYGAKTYYLGFATRGPRTSAGVWPGYKGKGDMWLNSAGITNQFGKADDYVFKINDAYPANPASVQPVLGTSWDDSTKPSMLSLNVDTWREQIRLADEQIPGNDVNMKGQPYLMYARPELNLANTPYPTADQMTPIPDGTTFNKGATLPFVYFNQLSNGLWGGSRDDVDSRMTWSKGWWTAEFARKLDTKHGDDVQFRPKQTPQVTFGVLALTKGQDLGYSVPAVLTFLPEGGS